MKDNTRIQKSRRKVLKSVVAGATIPAFTGKGLAANSPPDPRNNNELVEMLNEIDLYIEGLNVGVVSDVETLEDADLAVFGPKISISHGRIAGAINEGTAISIAGGLARRKLLSMLQGVPLGHVSPNDDRSPIISDEINYSFGYELPTKPKHGASLAYPATDGVLELHTREGKQRSDTHALQAILEEYLFAVTRDDQVGTMSHEGYDSDWEDNGRVSSTTENCGGGKYKEEIYNHVHPEKPITSWKYNDYMTAGQADGICDGYWLTGYNSQSYRRIKFGDYDGEILDYDPETTLSSSSASINISGGGIGASWQYEIPDVTVEATYNMDPSEEWIRWEHDIVNTSDIGSSTFVGKPGVIVEYPSGTSVANYYVETEFTFAGDGQIWTVYDDGSEGGWLID